MKKWLNLENDRDGQETDRGRQRQSTMEERSKMTRGNKKKERSEGDKKALMILAVYSKLFNTTEEFLLLAWHYWISVPSTFSKIVWICRRIGATYCHRSSRQCCTASHVSFKSVSAADWNLARAAKQKESLTVWRGRSFLYLTSLQTWESICLACLVNGSS